MTHIRIKNSNLLNHRTIMVEPWGNEISIGPGETLTLSFDAPEPENFDFEISDYLVAVYGWEGCIGYSYSLERF